MTTQDDINTGREDRGSSAGIEMRQAAHDCNDKLGCSRTLAKENEKPWPAE